MSITLGLLLLRSFYFLYKEVATEILSPPTKLPFLGQLQGTIGCLFSNPNLQYFSAVLIRGT